MKESTKMSGIRIYFLEGYFLSPLSLNDVGAMAEYLNDRIFHQTTAFVPYPYTEVDAKSWINSIKQKKIHIKDSVFAIRRVNDEKLIGEIIAYHSQLGSNGAIEIGYWLAKPYWKQGIMTQAVQVFVDYCFEELGVKSIFARAFDNNSASWHVLEKVGFQFQGTFYNHIPVDGKYLNDRIYIMLKENWQKKLEP